MRAHGLLQRWRDTDRRRRPGCSRVARSDELWHMNYLCVVHLVRASMRWVNYKDRKKVAAQLRSIYAAPTEQAARDALDAWTDSDIGRQYPAI